MMLGIWQINDLVYTEYMLNLKLCNLFNVTVFHLESSKLILVLLFLRNPKCYSINAPVPEVFTHLDLLLFLFSRIAKAFFILGLLNTFLKIQSFNFLLLLLFGFSNHCYVLASLWPPHTWFPHCLLFRIAQLCQVWHCSYC